MAQVARTRYSYYSSVAPKREPQATPRPDVRVIPGRRASNPAYQTLSQGTVNAFKFLLVALAIIAVIAGVRVWISSATLASLENVESLQSQLDEAQSSSNELEIQHSILASSSRIEQRATELGMTAPSDVTYLKVTLPGNVALNAAGNISIADTLQNIKNAAAAKAN